METSTSLWRSPGHNAWTAEPATSLSSTVEVSARKDTERQQRSALSLAPSERKAVARSPGAYRKVEQWLGAVQGRFQPVCDVIDTTSPRRWSAGAKDS